MSESGWELGLADAENAGVYFVTTEDLDTLGVAARDAGLQVRRIDLGGATARSQADAAAAHRHRARFPQRPRPQLGRAVGQPARPVVDARTPASRCCSKTAATCSRPTTEDFDTLLEILEESAQDWGERDIPFWSFIALPESVFDEIDAAAAE